MASPPLTDREYAYLRISNEDGSHSEITEILKLEPTNCWNKGDINRANNRPRNQVSWQLESGLDDTHPIEEHLDKIFSILTPLKSELVKLSDKYNICIQCVGYYHPSQHGIHLDHSTLEKAYSIGASFDFDCYFVDDYGHDLDYV
ncbi:MAG: DUF4279 domain-containing protein [Kangiellaceae bacterium]|nr:DUF4279 domain-containing protein [Kangiellaceae bacterium]